MKISKDGKCPYCHTGEGVDYGISVNGNKTNELECQNCYEWFRVRLVDIS